MVKRIKDHFKYPNKNKILQTSDIYQILHFVVNNETFSYNLSTLFITLFNNANLVTN